MKVLGCGTPYFIQRIYGPRYSCRKKTQTRRIVKPPKWSMPWGMNEISLWDGKPTVPDDDDATFFIECPYGQPGDRLWVRESWREECRSGQTLYRATDLGTYPPEEVKWKPSIHMHRHRSRILLEVVSVRVERLKGISENDALEEGFVKLPATGRIVMQKGDQYLGRYWSTARLAFHALWVSINGCESWDANPWVWVVEFKRVEA